MKNIGLITFHKYHNFGAVLQAFALQEYINKYCNGYECTIIDYFEPESVDISSFTPHRLYGDIQFKDDYTEERTRHYNDIIGRKKKFEDFQKKYYNLTSSYTSRSELLNNPPQFNIYITGSDQVWNWNREYRPYRLLPYLLWFTHSKNKIAYAAGMNSDERHNIIIPFSYIPALQAYQSIMLREESGILLIKKFQRNKDVSLVVDPTILLDPNDYQHVISKKIINHNYIFAYVFDYNMTEYKYILKQLKELANRENKEVILISNTVPVFSDNIRTVIDAGPAEWLNYLYYSDMVITNSFHGLAFAVNFNKPFFVFGRDERKNAILKYVKLKLTEPKTLNSILKFITTTKSLNYHDLNIRKEVSRKLLLEALRRCE